MILCVTPNPALDRTLQLDSLQHKQVQRPLQVHAVAGGKGLNVARCLGVLGRQALCAGPIGGHNGRLFAELAVREGLHGHWSPVAHETRICTILVEQDGSSTGIYERGEPLSAEEWQDCATTIVQLSQHSQAVCISGSLPQGVQSTQLATLIEQLTQHAPVWVDTSGAALRSTITAHPYAIKVNAEELGEVFGQSIETPAQAVQAAKQLVHAGVQVAVVSLGEQGAILCSTEGTWHALAPNITLVSAVGSGDALLAGLVAAWSQGQGLAQALQAGVAVGAANAMFSGVAQFSPQLVSSLIKQTQLIQL
jgi:1-phosphofructokinase